MKLFLPFIDKNLSLELFVQLPVFLILCMTAAKEEVQLLVIGIMKVMPTNPFMRTPVDN